MNGPRAEDRPVEKSMSSIQGKEKWRIALSGTGMEREGNREDVPAGGRGPQALQPSSKWGLLCIVSSQSCILVLNWALLTLLLGSY